MKVIGLSANDTSVADLVLHPAMVQCYSANCVNNDADDRSLLANKRQCHLSALFCASLPLASVTGH